MAGRGPRSESCRARPTRSPRPSSRPNKDPKLAKQLVIIYQGAREDASTAGQARETLDVGLSSVECRPDWRMIMGSFQWKICKRACARDVCRAANDAFEQGGLGSRVAVWEVLSSLGRTSGTSSWPSTPTPSPTTLYVALSRSSHRITLDRVNIECKVQQLAP